MAATSEVDLASEPSHSQDKSSQRNSLNCGEQDSGCHTRLLWQSLKAGRPTKARPSENKRSHPPPPHTHTNIAQVGCVIAACFPRPLNQHLQPVQIFFLLQAFNEMKAKARNDPTCMPNAISYSVLLKACRTGRRYDFAREVLEEALSLGFHSEEHRPGVVIVRGPQEPEEPSRRGRAADTLVSGATEAANGAGGWGREREPLRASRAENSQETYVYGEGIAAPCH